MEIKGEKEGGGLEGLEGYDTVPYSLRGGGIGWSGVEYSGLDSGVVRMLMALWGCTCVCE